MVILQINASGALGPKGPWRLFSGDIKTAFLQSQKFSEDRPDKVWAFPPNRFARMCSKNSA